MPNTYIRLNLASAIFPFYTEAAGRTIVIPGQDENWDRYNAANTVQDKGVPQVFYMHNCVPLAGGFQSIGYVEQLSGMLGHDDFDTCFSLINSNLGVDLFVPAGGLNYVYDGDVGQWVSVDPFEPGTVPAGITVSTAYVNGVTYILFAGYGCFSYNDTTKALDPVTLTGVTVADLVGICEANGYMIACSNTAVAWSSLSDPTDFVPSIDTAAGGGNVQDAKGPINFILGIAGGFLMYCARNIVGASYTGNTTWPYQILEIPGSGGVSSIDAVAYQGNLPYHVAMTTAGIQQISLNSAIPTMPEASDFLTSQLFEDFNETTLSFTQKYLDTQLVIKFACVADRYIILSYGPDTSNFTHAIVYDIGLNRYGKIKLLHRSAFMYSNPVPHGLITYSELMNTPIGSLGSNTYSNFFTALQSTVTPKGNLAFLQQDGTIQLVDFSVGETNADGVFIIGKFQNQRNETIVHQWTDVETINSDSTFSMSLLPTFDGKDFAPAIATIKTIKGTLVQRFSKRNTSANLSLCMVGAFNLTTIILNFTVGGYR